MKKSEIRYYGSFTDDFNTTADQDFKLPEDYRWVRGDIVSRALSALIYALAIVFSYIYCKLFLHMKITGRKNLKGVKGGFFYLRQPYTARRRRIYSGARGFSEKNIYRCKPCQLRNTCYRKNTSLFGGAADCRYASRHKRA